MRQILSRVFASISIVIEDGPTAKFFDSNLFSCPLARPVVGCSVSLTFRQTGWGSIFVRDAPGLASTLKIKSSFNQ
jgi:hypothetical protein